MAQAESCMLCLKKNKLCAAAGIDGSFWRNPVSYCRQLCKTAALEAGLSLPKTHADHTELVLIELQSDD